MVPYTDLFIWWAASISSSSVFLTLVSIYLYMDSRARRMEGSRAAASTGNVGKNFIFVWVLLGLLFFYIFSIQIGSIGIFAAGNIVVEAVLILYLMIYRKSGQI